MNLAFAVRDRRLTRKGLEPLAADTAGHITFTVDFDAEWTGMVKVVVFENGESRAELLYTGQAEIPAAVLGAGELYVSVNGYRSQGDTVAIVRTVAMARPVQILPAGAAPAGDPTAYTPTLLEQILAAAGEAGTAAAEAQAVKNELLADKEAGLFTGETGPAGESATIAVDGAYPVDLPPDTLGLLKAARHNEYQEFEHDYPRFARIAREEGFDFIGSRFEHIARIEQAHGDRFGALADLLEGGKLFDSGEKTAWMCLNCGEIVTASLAPNQCPVCDHERGYFIRLELAPFTRG